VALSNKSDSKESKAMMKKPQNFQSIVLFLIFGFSVLVVFLYLEKNNDVSSFKLTKKQLSSQTESVLNSLKDPVKLDIYSNKDSIIVNKIVKFLKPFQLLKPDFVIEIIDPKMNPSLVRENAISVEGEMLLSYQDKSVHITELSESALVNAILSVQRTKDEWLIVAEGYEMLSVTDDKDSGLFNLLVYLQKTGVKVARMPLNNSLELPENVKIIILPRPKQSLDSEIVLWLQQQLQKGLSIWWLTDPEVQNNQNYLELLFDVMIGDKQYIEGDQYSGILSKYMNHAITDKFNQPIYIAEAAEIISDSVQSIFKSSNDTASLFVSKVMGESRVIISGDVDMITNQYLNVAANKNFIIRSIDWLFHHDDRINLSVEIKNHTELNLSKPQLIILSLTLLIAIPFCYLLISFIQWRRSRVG
jgi:hypothetical protein